VLQNNITKVLRNNITNKEAPVQEGIAGDWGKLKSLK